MCGPALSARRSNCCVSRRRSRGTILVLDAMAAALLAQMLAQQLTGARIEQPHMCGIPLHLNAPADPARRRAVVSGFDFDAAIQMHGALAVLVIAERLERQRQQRGFSSANMAATCRLVVPWMRVSAQRSSQ